MDMKCELNYLKWAITPESPTGALSPAHPSPLTPMLDANDPAFREQYPNGAIVRDRLGRLLSGVVACHTETGEVIKHTQTEGGIVETHQTWPAPLTIEPCQWLHNRFDKP
jgi:hypothetical protein